MTHEDYINKKQRMIEISKNPFASDSENKEMIELVQEVAQYDANNELVDVNEFKEAKH